MNHLLTDFVTLLVVVNPVGNLPVFLAVTAGMSEARRRSIALRATLIALGILVFFIIAGQLLIGALGIGIDTFRLAGSIVLLVFGLKLVFDTAGGPPEAGGGGAGEEGEVSDTERAIFPVAMPSIAGPGTILAVVVLTDNDRFSLREQAETLAMLVLVLLVALALMLAAGPVLRVIRRAGANIVGRVMGLILCSLAVDGMVRAAFGLLRGVPPPLSPSGGGG